MALNLHTQAIREAGWQIHCERDLFDWEDFLGCVCQTYTASTHFSLERIFVMGRPTLKLPH